MSEAQQQQAAIDAIWLKQIAQTRERLELLERAAEELSSTRTIDPELRAKALDIAHKFAGSLGMFGYGEATDHARLIEETLHHAGLPQPERFQQHVDDLRLALQAALAK